MLLFSNEIDSNKNLLPYDGEVYYFGKILSIENAQEYYKNLLKKIQWKNDEAIIYGKKITTKREVAWYGDKAFDYTYSQITRKALPWTDDLLALKQIVETTTQSTYNACLLNLYHHGEEGMAWHSDAEKDLIKNGAIASLSLGAERKFSFKHKTTDEKIDILLEDGSILLMKGTTQTHWLHQLPVSKKVIAPRINLTFRTINIHHTQ